MNQYKAVLFDMDGVLIDSEALMTKVGILALRDYGIEAQPDDFIPFVGRGEDMYIGGVAKKYGREYDPEMKVRAYTYFGKYVEAEARVPDELPELLFRLKRLGYRICVCTSADWMKVEHNLRAIGAKKEDFDAFVTGDRIVRKKPDPEIYLKGAAMLGISPEHCAVVEDAPNGIMAAHAAGMFAIGIDTSFPAEVLKEQSAPDRIIHSLSELIGCLTGQ